MQKASHAGQHDDEEKHCHGSERLPSMKSAAFKLDDVKPYGNVKIYNIDSDSNHNHKEEHAETNRNSKSGKKKKFDPNDMILDNNIVIGGGEDREHDKMAREEKDILENHKHAIPQGNPHALFEFRSVKFQTFVDPKIEADAEGNRKVTTHEDYQNQQELDQIFIKEYEKTNSQVTILQGHSLE